MKIFDMSSKNQRYSMRKVEPRAANEDHMKVAHMEPERKPT